MLAEEDVRRIVREEIVEHERRTLEALADSGDKLAAEILGRTAED